MTDFSQKQMDSEKLIEQIAEVLFKEEEIEAWSIYDNLEAIFERERPNLVKEYKAWAKNEEIRQKEQEIMELSFKLSAVKEQLETIKKN